MSRCGILAALGFLIGIVPTHTQAQFNVLPGSNAQWHVYRYNGPNFDSEIKYFISGEDTLINAQLYKKLYITSGVPNPSYYSGAIRENGLGQVYYHAWLNGQTYLLYDFDVLPGDTVSDVFLDAYTVDMLVNTVDTILVAGTLRKRIAIQQLPTSSSTPNFHFWIQGIGGTGGLLTTNGGFISVSGSTELECMSANDTIMYGANAGQPGDCFLITDVPEQENNKALVAHPNPSTGLFTLSTTAGNITVHDASGRQVLSIQGNTIDLSAHPPGHYRAQVITEQGLVTLPLVVVR